MMLHTGKCSAMKENTVCWALGFIYTRAKENAKAIFSLILVAAAVAVV